MTKPPQQRRMVHLEPKALRITTDYTRTVHPQTSYIQLPSPVAANNKNKRLGYVQANFPHYFAKANTIAYMNPQSSMVQGFYFSVTISIATAYIETLIDAGLQVFAYFKEGFYDWGAANSYFMLVSPADKEKWHRVELFADDDPNYQHKFSAIMTGHKEKYNIIDAPSAFTFVTFRRRLAPMYTNLDLGDAPISIFPIDLFPMSLVYFTVKYNGVEVCTPYNASHPSYPSEVYNSTHLSWDSTWSKWKLDVAAFKDGTYIDHIKMARLIPTKHKDSLATISLLNPQHWKIHWLDFSDFFAEIFGDDDDEEEQLAKKLAIQVSLIFTKAMVIDMAYNLPGIDWSKARIPIPYWLGLLRLVKGSGGWTFKPGSGRTNAVWGDVFLDGVLFVIILIITAKIAPHAPKIAKKIWAVLLSKRKTKKLHARIDKAAEMLELQLDMFNETIDEKVYLLELLPEMTNLLRQVHDSTVNSRQRAVISEVMTTMATWQLTSTPPKPGQVNEVLNKLSVLI